MPGPLCVGVHPQLWQGAAFALQNLERSEGLWPERLPRHTEAHCTQTRRQLHTALSTPKAVHLIE